MRSFSTGWPSSNSTIFCEPTTVSRRSLRGSSHDSYTCAIIAWTCIGRFLMTAFLPPDHPNYIFRFFKLVTNWAVSLTDWVSPRFINLRFMPLVTAFLIGGFSWIGLAVAIASVLGFIANEPIMIATGRRGPRGWAVAGDRRRCSTRSPLTVRPV